MFKKTRTRTRIQNLRNIVKKQRFEDRVIIASYHWFKSFERTANFPTGLLPHLNIWTKSDYIKAVKSHKEYNQYIKTPEDFCGIIWTSRFDKARYTIMKDEDELVILVDNYRIGVDEYCMENKQFFQELMRIGVIEETIEHSGNIWEIHCSHLDFCEIVLMFVDVMGDM